MRWCSTSLVIREIPIKTTMRSHCTPIKMAEMTSHTRCRWGCGGKELAYTPGRNRKYNHVGNEYDSFIHLPYDPDIPLLNIYPREMKTYVHTDLYMNVHYTFICKSHKLQTTQIHMNRNRFWLSIQWDTTQQKRERTTIPTTWRNLKIIIVSECS